jgi:hypothetical protein
VQPAPLGYVLFPPEEDAKVFLQSEEAYAVTPQQKRQLRDAQRIYQSHPIKF